MILLWNDIRYDYSVFSNHILIDQLLLAVNRQIKRLFIRFPQADWVACVNHASSAVAHNTKRLKSPFLHLNKGPCTAYITQFAPVVSKGESGGQICSSLFHRVLFNVYLKLNHLTRSRECHTISYKLFMLNYCH